MRIPRIFSYERLSGAVGGSERARAIRFTTSASEQVNYLFRVLRMKAGDKVYLFDGTSGQWLAEVADISRQRVIFSLETFFPDPEKASTTIDLGQCLSRGERMDYAIQKAVEMGVDSITPLFSAYCEVKLNKERQEKRREHWQRLAISACEQCGRNRIPVINAVTSLEAWSRSCQSEIKLILHPGSVKTFAKNSKPSSVSVVAGPEGGFADEEVKSMRQQGFKSVTLGPRILRTETAPVAALAVIQYLWGDWNQ